MNNSEFNGIVGLKKYNFGIKYYDGWHTEVLELPEDIELTVLYSDGKYGTKYIAFGTHIDDDDIIYDYKDCEVYNFGKYDMFVFSQVKLADDKIKVIDFKEFADKWTAVIKKYYLAMYYLDTDETYACGYIKKYYSIAKFIGFNETGTDDFLKVKRVYFCSDINPYEDNIKMVIEDIRLDDKFWPNDRHTNIKSKIVSSDKVAVDFVNRRNLIIGIFNETYKYEDVCKNPMNVYPGQILSDGENYLIFDKYNEGYIFGDINGFKAHCLFLDKADDCVMNPEAVFSLGFWLVASEEICDYVHKKLAAMGMYYDPDTNSLQKEIDGE